MNGPFKKDPLWWIFYNLIYPRLSLLNKAKTLNWKIQWKNYRRHFKDQLLGELVVVTVSVDKDWEFVHGEHTQTRVRDIVYRWKRAKLPFAYRKTYSGTQCTDEFALPLNRVPHQEVANLQDRIFRHNEWVLGVNAKRNYHRSLRESIVNHQFQEYDHEVKN